MGITQVRGADINHPDGPIVDFSGASGSTAINATAPSLTTVDCNTLVMSFFTNKKNSTWTPPAGSIEVYDDPNNQQGLTSNMMSYFIQGEPGETGSLTATASSAENWVAQAIAIRPLVINPENARINPDTLVSSMEELNAAFEEDELGELKAYPNPLKDRLNLSLGGYFDTAPDQSSLFIMDAAGRNLPWRGVWHEDEQRLELDFSQMNVGWYIINLKTPFGMKSIRVVKN
jgi:hypothetical protein